MRRIAAHTLTGLAVAVSALCLSIGAVVAFANPASAQIDLDAIVSDLESDGFYIEDGADGESSRFRDLVSQASSSDDTWYFVSMADIVDDDFADQLRDEVTPTGNVLVFYLEDFDGELYENVQLSTPYSEDVEDSALAPFDGDWQLVSEFMSDVVDRLDSLVPAASGSSSSGSTASSGSSSSGSSSGSTTTTTTTTTPTTTSADDSGGGGKWLWLGVPVAVAGGAFFVSRRNRNKKADEELERAAKIRAEIQTELDELANDVIVLSGPVDLSENAQATQHYRDAAATYNEISDELPDVAQLEDADLAALSELGARVAHARWQMDAAEALMAGEPVPEKPKVAPPPPPPRPPAQQAPPPPRLPQRQPRPRVPYSRSRRRSGGGLLDILIAGGGMMGRGRGRTRRSGGGMFGGGSSTRRPPSTSRPRSGGGVFGGGSSSRSSSGSRSRSRSSSRSSSRSTSRRRKSTRSSSRRRRR